jgi:hypothetical protein
VSKTEQLKIWRGFKKQSLWPHAVRATVLSAPAVGVELGVEPHHTGQRRVERDERGDRVRGSRSSGGVGWAAEQGDIAKEAVAAGSKGLAFARVAEDGSGALEGAKALVEGLDDTQTAALIERTGAEVCSPTLACSAPPSPHHTGCLLGWREQA